MSKIQQTKGTFRLNGKSNIEKVSSKDFGWMQKANMTVKTLKDNFVGVTFETKNGNGLDVSIKNVGDEKSHKVDHLNVVNELKDTFKNDDMLFVMGVVDYDTYRKEFVLKPTGVYHSDKNYDDEEFKETNFVEQEFIFDSFNGKVAKLNVVSYFGEVNEVEMRVDDEIKEEFESFKTGDLLKLVFSVINKPIYVDKEDKKGVYKPKGKGVINTNSNKKTIDGYETYNIVVGIANVESGKYTRKDIRETQEEFERKQAEYAATKTDNKLQVENNEDDGLPY